MDLKKIKEQLDFCCERTNLDFGIKKEGKVRDNYFLDDKIIMITTDRISAFDYVLGTIPFKGQVLNQLALWWFEKTEDIVQNHILENPDPNVMIVKKCQTLPVEIIVRGYITGVTKTSAWWNYSQGKREICGVKLPEGLNKDQKLPYPIITPTTKAEKGEHDELISKKEIIERGLVDKNIYEEIEKIALKLYERGVNIAADRGLILVDTKYEFGLYDGKIVLIDELHTPDSSRYWFKESYEVLFKQGKEQRKLDKEFVRKWLIDKGYNREGLPPKLDDEIRVNAALKYIEIYELMTGEKFECEVGDVEKRIKKNLM